MNIPNNLFIIVDILVAVILLFCIIKGVINGFVFELINIVFLAATCFIAYLVSPILAIKAQILDLASENELADKVVDTFNINITVNTVLWFVIIVLVLNLIFMIVKPLFKTVSKIPVIGSVNRILGGLIGGLRGFVICLFISVLITMPVIKNGKEVKEASVLRYADDITDYATKFIVKNVNLDNIKQEVDDFDVDKARNDLLTWLIDQGVLDE
ncbi:MAG: CvpA family protein [Erysipelotrichaceae bacterium]|nr:CvpA family protein [Erysipelotrichaceae bacterium]